MRKLFIILCGCLFWTWPSQAIPVLQLYLEDAVYDESTETWIGNGAGALRLWTIGDAGDYGTISSVKLAIAYDSADSPIIQLTPSTTGDYGGFIDPSTPNLPVQLRTVTDGSSPTLTNGSSLPSHGVYGSGTSWVEFSLGNFTLLDSPSGDFIDSFPTPIPVGNSAHPGSQINVYEVLITGTSEVHFDLYNGIQAGNHTKFKFAPFSHDVGGSAVTSVPENSMTLVLLGIALFGLFGSVRIALATASRRMPDSDSLAGASLD